MIRIEIPGYTTLTLKALVLDANGTIACDGKLIDGVQERIARLRDLLDVYIITANTHGRQHEIDALLQISSKIIHPGCEAQEKAEFIRELGREQVVAVGNGANDVEMLQEAALAIAVLQQEGLCTETLLHSDVLVKSICDALDLLLIPNRLRATLRR